MAANTGQSAPDDQWLVTLQEDVLEPELPIIDPHHHPDAHPEMTITLNHVGSPILGGPYRGKTGEVFQEWKAAIGRISERDNVFVKLGALPIRMPSYDGDRSLPPGSEEVAAAWRPWMEVCIEAFGSARSMYESNFPVQKRWCSYQVCWNAFKRISAGASAAEKTDLFSGAAARAYRIENVPLAE